MGQKRTTETQPDKKNGHKPEPVVLPQQAVEFVGVNELPVGLVGANGDGSLDAQAVRLADTRLQAAQRRALAGHIGQMHGNMHLQRVVQAAARKSKTHPNGNKSNGNGHTPENTSSAESTGDLEGVGAGGSLVFSGAGLPPNGSGTNGDGPHPHLQRQEEGGEEEQKPSEEERARALAAARAAEQVANQAQSTSQAETAKSQNAESAEAQAGKTAKAQAQQASAEAKSLKGKGAEGAKGAGTEKPGALRGVDGKGGPAGEAEQPAGEIAPLTAEKAPASAEADPAFQAVLGRVKGVSAREKAHTPASSKAAEAQAASVPPANEMPSKAQANQVGEMEQAETPAFDAKAFKAQLMQRIQALAPKSMKEADEFKDGNKLGGMKGEMQGKVEQEKSASQGTLKQKTEAAPDPSGIEPKEVSPLPAAEPGAAPADIGAQGAAPKPKTSAEVEKPIQESSQSIDQQMADAEVSEDQLANSNEPEFQGALASKQEAQTHAAQAPQQYRSFEGEQVSQAQNEATGAAQAQMQAMHGDRAALLTQVMGQQTGAKTQDEAARAKVAGDIQQIYDRTKTNVERILAKLDTDVDKAFDEGAEAAKQVFEDYVDAKMEAYKEDRYGGWFGWARWAKDKLFGMPGEVNAFYSEGRSLFIQKMDAVIDNVVAIIGRALSEAKAEVANGKKEVQAYVEKLPADLRQVGEQAANDIQGKFDELESSIDSKQNELIERLASKYNEKLQAIDARIEELKAANQGLVDKAINAVVGVIKTILRLKDMLLNVLAKVADVVMGIIKNPVGFLGNLISGIKLGLENFITGLPKHLLNSLVAWLTGALGPLGIKLPDDLFSLEGIFSLVMQILGLTWDAIRAKAVKLLGEPVVKALESGFEIFKILITEGPIGLWKYVKEMFANLKEMVIDAITDMIQSEVVQAGIKWIMGLLTPAGAFIKAAMAIYDIVKFFIEKASQIGDLISAVIDGIAAIAGGAISGAAKLIEDALARALPIVIGFLANLLGIGDLAKKVQGIIEKIREKIDQAIDWVITKAKAVAGKVMGKLGFGEKGKEEEGETPTKGEVTTANVESIPEGLPPEEVKRSVLDMVQSKLLATDVTSIKAVHGILQSVMNANRVRGLRGLSVRIDDQSSMSVRIEASASEPAGRRIAWSDIFAPSTLNASDEIDELRKKLSKASQASYASVVVDGRQVGSMSESGGGTHAEEALVRGPSWSQAIDAAREGVQQKGSSRVTLMINRTPCVSCVTWLSEAIESAKSKLGPADNKVIFLLAATGTYRRQARMSEEDKAALKTGSERLAKRLGRPFDEVFAEQEEIWKEDLRSFSTEWRDPEDDEEEQASGLSKLAGAGWQIAGIDFGKPPTARQLELAQIAARLAKEFEWDS